MSAKRIAMIALGVSAIALFIVLLRGPLDPQQTTAQEERAALERRQPPIDASNRSDTPALSPEPTTAEFSFEVEQQPVAFTPLPDTSPAWGRDFDECKSKHIVAISVCKHNWEPRDPNWAPQVEQSIRDFVADTLLLRLPAEDSAQHLLECRATFCQVRLYVDREGLTDHLRAVGRYDPNKAREHEFFYLTFSLTPSADGTRDGRWAQDRAEELRLALVLRGLLRADSTVAVHAHEPVYREKDSYLYFEVSRCPNLNDLCAAQ